MAFDEDGETDAAERYAELTGAVIEDLEEDDEDVDGELSADGDEDAEDFDIENVDDELDVDEDPEDEDLEGDADIRIDDVATLDAEIEAEDVLDEDKLILGRAGEDEDLAAEDKPEKVETGVGPAFIEPDFGDILDDSSDDTADEDKANKK
ncbi:hypothetical protein ACQPYK_31565 [Streptosporangium sp. CA-135522]|uniref:hypothetical protein n=1 Tax=Streptosporangium sp. CA-135522 TaxID=3240072 RepID=UPI003D8CD9A6